MAELWDAILLALKKKISVIYHASKFGKASLALVSLVVRLPFVSASRFDSRPGSRVRFPPGADFILN
jgi:hypothetical protein